MLRRRLLLLSAVLLATGALAAALTPRDLRQGTATTPTATTAPPPRAAPGGGTPAGARERRASFDAAARQPTVVRVRQGTLLHVVVQAPAPDEVELVGLGRFEAVDQFSPARFDFFAKRAGTFPVRLRESDRVIGRLVVDARPL